MKKSPLKKSPIKRANLENQENQENIYGKQLQNSTLQGKENTLTQ